jgi:hypothetical protein
VTVRTSRRLVLSGRCIRCHGKLRISATLGSVTRLTGELGEDVDVWCPSCNKKTTLTITDDNRHFVGVEPTEQDATGEQVEADGGPGF